jgi:hypothetical protein
MRWRFPMTGHGLGPGGSRYRGLCARQRRRVVVAVRNSTVAKMDEAHGGSSMDFKLHLVALNGELSEISPGVKAL